MRTCERCDRQVLATADGRCPGCDAQLLEPETPEVLRVTLSPGTKQPHVCLQCGAPTHRRVRVRVVGPRPPLIRTKTKVPWELHLIGGIGCLASIVAGLSDLWRDSVQQRRPTLCVKVRQCSQCGNEGRPQGFAPEFRARRLSFDAHPRYLEALARMNRDARQDARLKTTPSRGDDDARPISPS